MRRIQLVALVVFGGLLCFIQPVRADILYNQSTNYNSAFASQNDTNSGGLGSFATAYDNFTLGATSNITSVEWIGSYFNGSPTTINGFTLNFYADNSGTPGTLLATTGDVAGNAGEAFLQNDNLGNPAYQYSLNTAFTASAGVQYWLSIVPDIGFPPQWGWESGTGGDGAAYQCFLGSCGPITTNDLAFTLLGAAVSNTPEPSSLFMLGAGLIGLMGMARRQKGKGKASVSPLL